VPAKPSRAPPDTGRPPLHADRSAFVRTPLGRESTKPSSLERPLCRIVQRILHCLALVLGWTFLDPSAAGVFVDASKQFVEFLGQGLLEDCAERASKSSFAVQPPAAGRRASIRAFVRTSKQRAWLELFQGTGLDFARVLNFWGCEHPASSLPSLRN